MVDIRHMEYFLEVARLKSFSAAAESLHVTQPTISKVIKELELELCKTLFNRSSKYVQLTDTGELLYSTAQQIVDLFVNMTKDIDNFAQVEKGKITIGLPPITAATIFAKILGDFKMRYPKIEIILFENGSKSVETGVQNGTIDLGLVCSHVSNENYGVVEFCKDPLMLVANSSHPLARRVFVDLKSLMEENFVLFRQDFSLYEKIIQRCELAGFKPNVIFETSQQELMLEIVANKMGVTLLPSKICTKIDPAKFVFLPIDDPQIYLELSLIWNKKRKLSYASTLWIEFVQNNLVHI